MSDTPQGGWWKASDGKWYPPETHPDQASYVGADAVGESVAATPAAGWWQASDGNWYPPDSVPGPVIDLGDDLGDDLGPELPSHLAESDLTVTEPEIDLTDRPDVTADGSDFDLGGAAEAPGTSTSSFWGESVVTTAAPTVPPAFAEVLADPSVLGDTPVNGVTTPFASDPGITVVEEPASPVVEEPAVLAVELDAEPVIDLPGRNAEPIEGLVVESDVPVSPFVVPSDPDTVPTAESPPEPRSLFGAPQVEQTELPSPFGDLVDAPVVSPVSPFAVPGDAVASPPGSLFGAPPPVEDAAVSYSAPSADPTFEPPPFVEPEAMPGALPVTPPDADPRRGLFDLDDRPPESGQTAKRPLFGGMPAATPVDQPPAIEFDATGSDQAPIGTGPPIGTAKPVKAAGDRKRLLVLLGVLAGVVVIGGLLFVLLGRGGDETAEGTTTVPATDGTGAQETTASAAESTEDSSTAPAEEAPDTVFPTTVPPPAEIPGQVSGVGAATADLGHDVSDMLLALITHDGPGGASFDLLGADGNVVQQLVGPGVSGQYLGVVPVNFAQGQSFRSVRFDGEGPWAVTFAVTSSAPAISTNPGSTFSESGDRVVVVDGTASFRLQSACDACTSPLQVRAWPTGSTTAPEPLVADGGILEVPAGTAWLQITAAGAASTMPGWSLSVG